MRLGKTDGLELHTRRSTLDAQRRMRSRMSADPIIPRVPNLVPGFILRTCWLQGFLALRLSIPTACCVLNQRDCKTDDIPGPRR